MKWDCGCAKRREAMKAAFRNIVNKLRSKKPQPQPKSKGK